MIEVGIIGYGVVGQALGQFALKDQIKVIPFDLYQERFNSPQQMLTAFNADIVFVCVPTPTDPEDDMLDISLVLDTACKWNEFTAKPNSVLVIKSTIPPGTTDEIIDYLDNDRIVHNPEFLNQATAREDFLAEDHIVIAGPNSNCVQKVSELYEIFYRARGKDDLRIQINSDPKIAELTKMIRNAFYLTKLSFMNDVSELCQQVGVEYNNLQPLFAQQGHNSWIDPQHTKVPGLDGKNGVGGKCLPKDSLGLVALADIYKVDMSVLKAANKSNQRRRPEVYEI
jgi:UDPglucose 6-dehydrogenase